MWPSRWIKWGLDFPISSLRQRCDPSHSQMIPVFTESGSGVRVGLSRVVFFLISGLVSLSSKHRNVWQCWQLVNGSILVSVFRNCRNHQLTVFWNHCEISLDLRVFVTKVTQCSFSFGGQNDALEQQLASLQRQSSLAEVHVSLVLPLDATRPLGEQHLPWLT